MPRLFIAIDIPESAYKAFAPLRAGDMGWRWTAADQFHLTLRFLGDVPEDDITSVAEHIDAHFDPLAGEPRLSGEGLTVFPSHRNPRVLIERITSARWLDDLHDQIKAGVQAAGFEAEERPYIPHLTLARIKHSSPQDVRAFIKRHDAAGRLSSIEAQAFHLYESDLKPGGAVHHVRHTWPLREQS